MKKSLLTFTLLLSIGNLTVASMEKREKKLEHKKMKIEKDYHEHPLKELHLEIIEYKKEIQILEYKHGVKIREENGKYYWTTSKKYEQKYYTQTANLFLEKKDLSGGKCLHEYTLHLFRRKFQNKEDSYLYLIDELTKNKKNNTPVLAKKNIYSSSFEKKDLSQKENNLLIMYKLLDLLKRKEPNFDFQNPNANLSCDL